MKIDIFNHVMPVPYLDMMKQHLKDQGILKRMSNLRMLWDIEARVRMLDEVLDVSVVPTTPIVGVMTLVTVGGVEALNGSEVTTVWTDEPVIPMVGVDVVVVEVWVLPSR